MCFSASVSYGTAALLLPTGIYAFHKARRLDRPYWIIALVPIFFGIQQGFEGRVWQAFEAGAAIDPLPFALGFHFFSHFLWLWWIPLSSSLVETERVRRRIFLGVALFGLLAGGVVYFTLLFHTDWLSIEVEKQRIIYNISSPYRWSIDLKIPPSALYGLIILVPLLASSHRPIRTFGWLIALSVLLASLAYGYAFVSVWCFFAAALSIYLVYMIHSLPDDGGTERAPGDEGDRSRFAA